MLCVWSLLLLLIYAAFQNEFCRSDEVDILTMDLERASQKQATAEKELEALKGQLQSTTQSLQQAEQMQKAPNVVR